MKNKKLLILCALTLGFIALISFRPDGDDGPPGETPVYADVNTFEETPPVIEGFYVQKLVDVLEDGSNMVLQVQFAAGQNLPPMLDIYTGEDRPVTFYDDGTGADNEAYDGKYAAYITEDLSTFTDKIQAMEAQLTEQGGFTKWTGHLGEEITGVPHFDADGFNNNELVPIEPKLLGFHCGENDLLKQNSLFITDLSVVEDSARTYNFVSGTGNPNGVWAFGQMMKNMAHTSATGISAKAFMKSWVKQWTADQVVNGQTVATRISDTSGQKDVFEYLIGPWLKKAYNDSMLQIRATNWEMLWDNSAITSDMLAYSAPFRLMAIVNRLDLRNNGAFIHDVKRGGETRFIFTLIAPYSMGGQTRGMPPIHFDQDFGPHESFLDWIGMNVIFEYGNIPTTACGIKNLGQQWADLSFLTLGNSSYKAALQTITDQVTTQNAIPSRPNGSAILRIRTNERIFFSTDRSLSGVNVAEHGWKHSKWELRQFEINAATHLLESAPVFNTPVPAAPYLYNLSEGTPSVLGINSRFIDSIGTRMLDWVYSPLVKTRVFNGTHSMPLTFPGTGIPFTAGSALVTHDYVTYTEFPVYETVTDNFNWNNISSNSIDHPYEKQLRQQFSVNTCQGCHNADTKTIFTHIRPLGYGETAKYWETAPDTIRGAIDNRFDYIDSALVLSYNHIDSPVTVRATYAPLTGIRYVDKVSAFLTGRSYSGRIGHGTFQDDRINAIEDGSDSLFGTGKFYVNDIANWNDGPIYHDKMVGFNELGKRKEDLCNLIAISCSRNTAQVINQLLHIPLHD